MDMMDSRVKNKDKKQLGLVLTKYGRSFACQVGA
jgi:hypothetical protein